MDTAAYGAFFREHIRSDSDVVFHKADLHPPDFDTLRAVSWVRTDEAVTVNDRLIARDEAYKWTPLLINKAGLYPLGGAFREYVLEPLFCRSNAVTWRNHEASYALRHLGSRHALGMGARRDIRVGRVLSAKHDPRGSRGGRSVVA